MVRISLNRYKILLTSFLNEKISSIEFEKRYLAEYKNDSTDWCDDEFQILDTLFYHVDRFCFEDELRDPEDLDEQGLRIVCKDVLHQIDSLK